MNKFRRHNLFIPILLLMTVTTSCGDDDETPQEVDVFLGCCSEDPVFGANVNNLDQSTGGEISVSDIITPNNDGVNDRFGINNIQNYDNHTVTIYASNDDIILESTNYGSDTGEFFPWQQAQGSFIALDDIPDGTYKYKIVIENENTFFKSGTFCLFTNNPPLAQQNFSECIEPGDFFDPTLSGN